MAQTALRNSFLLMFSALLLTVFSVALLPVPAQALEPVNSSWFRGVAIKGIDPVAYFTEGRPVEGQSTHQFKWKGATWRFASRENLDLFRKNPEKYAPRYGGYCAWAVSQGYTADIDPKAWTIHQGRLYLNYSKSVQKQWLADRDALIKKADLNWPRLLSEN